MLEKEEKMEKASLVSLIIAVPFFCVGIAGLFIDNRPVAITGVLGSIILLVPPVLYMKYDWEHNCETTKSKRNFKPRFYVFWSLLFSIMVLSALVCVSICVYNFAQTLWMANVIGLSIALVTGISFMMFAGHIQKYKYVKSMYTSCKTKNI